jgi:hypothetical protein
MEENQTGMRPAKLLRPKAGSRYRLPIAARRYRRITHLL